MIIIISKYKAGCHTYFFDNRYDSWSFKNIEYYLAYRGMTVTLCKKSKLNRIVSRPLTNLKTKKLREKKIQQKQL